MRQEGTPIEGCNANEDMHHRRLMLVLQELVREEGVMEAARVLGIDYKTLARSMKAGRLSKKMRWAVERLQQGEGSAAAKHWERNAKMKDRLAKLDEDLRNGLAELRTALDGQRQGFARQREEHFRHQRRVEKQLAALVLGNIVTVPEPPGIEENGADESGVAGTGSGPPWWRPGKAAEDRVMDLVHEWWLARNTLLDAEERVNIAMGWDRFADLAVRDDSADALDEPQTPRPAMRSRRRYAKSKRVEPDVSEAY